MHGHPFIQAARDARHSHKSPSRNSLCTLLHCVIGWILKQSISGCRNEPSILEVNTLLFMRGDENAVKRYFRKRKKKKKKNLPDVKHTLD